MAFPYADLKAVADELIPDAGVAVVLTRPSRSAGLEAWEQDQGPAATAGAQSITGIYGIQIRLDKETLEDQTAEQKLARWALTATTEIPEEVGTEWSLVAKGNTYPIVSVKPVEPGDLLLMYFAVVKL